MGELDRGKQGFQLWTAHVVLPAYNEAVSLPSVFERLVAVQSEVEPRLIAWVVDDGSTDETPVVAECGVAGLDVKLVSHSNNLGLGRAIHSGLVAVLEVASEDDVVVVMDADDTHDVRLIKPLATLLGGGADIAIASRFVEGGDHSTAPLHRRFLSRAASLILGWILPFRGVKDLTSGYRAYRVGLLRRAADYWGSRLIEERGFACMVELLLKLKCCDPVIAEAPLVLRYDLKRSPSKLKIGKTILQYLKLALRCRLWTAPR